MFKLVCLLLFSICIAAVLAGLSSADVGTAPLPSIFWTSQPVLPDETVVAAGEYFGQTPSIELQRLSDTDPKRPDLDLWANNVKSSLGAAVTVTPSLVTDRNIEFTLPPSSTPAVYTYFVQSENGAGQAQLINAPQPWFIQGDLGDTASPGGWIGVFGTCIALPGKLRPLLALVSDGKIAAVVSARAGADGTGFGQYFPLPKNLPLAEYSLYASNGHGGRAGWVKVQTYLTEAVNTIVVRNPPAWPTTVFELSTASAQDADAAFSSAFDKIRANGGGVLSIPDGIYMLTKPLLIPDLTVIRGAGMGATVLKWTADTTDKNGRPLPLITGEVVSRPTDSSNTRASFSLEDFSVAASPTYGGRAVVRDSCTIPSYFKRISVLVPQLSPAADAAAVQIEFTKNLLIQDCILDARTDIYGYYSSCHYIRVAGNTLRWRNSPFFLQRDTSDIIYEHNKEVMAGTWAGNGFTKEMNANPGLAYVGYDSSNTTGFYYAHNVTSREEPDVPDGSIGMTFDGQTNTYCGKVSAVAGIHLTLASTTSAADIYNHPPCRPGASICIIDGKGAGQWRWVTSSDTTKTTHIDIDRPWDVEPDSTSWIGITNYLGQAIFVDNTFGNDPLLQTYFGTHDVIFAGNKLGVDGIKVNVVDWADAPMPGWHYQVLDNTIGKSGASMETALPSWVTPTNYNGPITGTIIYRDNAGSSNAPFEIEAPAHAQGFLIENNVGLSGLHLEKAKDSTGIIRGNVDQQGNAAGG